mmetsp:Transcript_35817/g.34854  ORF Transcript_35817/g.34854 Transcript_35817/m.34854 type:complete len:123 (-) Transcript_35817:42-410(-)|eukprot:CAMPEP_0170556756 /NCGR_PEP_ID=MMETSP0211-20121228/18508_1 /TAXON_ID=311385 /ORGANISM="Pseudokeronopsis sp., Strain OXSARD2" /LENGTH=122 /DNA_ID=CAMNT_0010867293 /DNA_START=147 /DNA_END=515 /DNA_ORIENTATION=-
MFNGLVESTPVGAMYTFAFHGNRNYYHREINTKWLTVSLEEETLFNRMFLQFYNYDDRYYTYDMEVSKDGANWTKLASSAYGKNTEAIVFEEDVSAKYIRFQGKSDRGGNYIDLLYVKLDYY